MVGLMFFEWWMIVILISASVIWGEIRYKDGLKISINNIMGYKLEGAHNAISNLEYNGIIKLENDGTFVGLNNNKWHPLNNIDHE